MGNIVKRIVIVALVIGGAWGAWAFFKGNSKDPKDQVKYEETAASTGDVRSFVSATGVIQPWKTVDVKSNVAGRIDKLYVDLGATVKAGQTVADIDPTDTQTALEQARFDLDSARAKRAQAVESVSQQEIQARSHIHSAQRAVSTAKAKMAQAKANMDVQPDLTTLGISQAQAQKVSADRAIGTAQENKKELEEQLSQLKEVTIPLNIKTVNSTVEQAKANLLTAQSDNNRQRQLLAQGYVAKSDVETAYSRMKTQQAAVDQAVQRQATIKRENDLAIRELQARVNGADSAIEEARARADAAEASLNLSKKQGVQDEVRREDYNAAKAEVAQAQAELDGATAEMKLLQVRRGDVLVAKATIDKGEAAEKQAVVNRGYTRVVAPRDGVIIAKNVEEGTVVPSSRTSIGSTNALLQIGDTSRIWVVCDVDETDIGQVQEKQKVTVKVDAYPSLLVEGKVIRVDPQAKVEQNVTLIPVTVELDSPDPRFKPGMNATCEFIVDEVSNVVTVPNEAVKEKGEGEFYVQVLEAGKPKDVPVDVGLAGPDSTQIRSGIIDGEKVITRTIMPEKAQATNPFGGPFGGGGNRGGGGRGGGGGGGRGGGR